METPNGTEQRQEEQPVNASKPNSKESILDFAKFAVIAVIVVIPIRLFVAQPFVVSGASMVPSFESGHYLIIDELSYHFEEPQRGDVIVFRFPQETSKFLIKRVAALPGETIEIKGNDVRIVNTLHPEGFLWEQGKINSSRTSGDQKVTLGTDEYFVLGDNRDQSADSRLWGVLKREFIVGRPLFRLFPISEIGIFPGEWNATE